MLLGQLQWLLTIGRRDLCQVIHPLTGLACVFVNTTWILQSASSDIKTTINKCIANDSRPLQYDRTTPNFVELIPDFLDDYPEDAKEEMDPKFQRHLVLFSRQPFSATPTMFMICKHDVPSPNSLPM